MGQHNGKVTRELDGLLIVDKPEGPTSHDVVAAVRRQLKLRKVGHTGTLDPMATGVLPLVLGRATKLARYLTGGDKAYLATLKLGETTRTLDKESPIEQTRPIDGIDEAAIEAALVALRGEIEQVPPMYSAKKIEGQKLYQLARKGLDISREAKRVTVHELRLVEVSLPNVVVSVRCSAGTYVRVLAQDIGEALGCGAHLIALQRTHAGPFGVADMTPLDTVLAEPERIAQRVLPVSTALGGLPRLDVPDTIGRRLLRGYQLCVADLRASRAPQFLHDDALAVGTLNGDLIAVVRAELNSDDLPCSRREKRALKTERVLSASH